MENKHPTPKLERNLSLNSEPRTLTKEQYNLARAAAVSMHALEKSNDAGTTNDAEAKGSNAKPDHGGGSSSPTAVKLPA